MPTTQIAPTSDPTLTKLLEVDSDLASQETQLTEQLEALTTKRKGLQTVIGIFAPGSEIAVSNTALPKVDHQNGSIAGAVEAVVEATEASETTPKRGKKMSSLSDKTKQKTTQTRAKGSRQTENWQQYMKREFGQASLPEAVSRVLQSYPNEALETPTIVNAIFTDKMPLELRNQARDRVSNVLSVGLKDNKWYRGQKGCYSASKTAAAASMA
ncbi:MAG: hypothetical protein HC840_05550 [Leptolyngbyaceae cyanobacterium RM2_2_4]|nr:hypothetical protein [Leptolyngbyaceae cyanobacterium RM2_2_4]